MDQKAEYGESKRKKMKAKKWEMKKMMHTRKE